MSENITITTLGNSLKATLANSFNQIGGKYINMYYSFKYEPDENGEYPYLNCMAAVGVVFMTVVAVNRCLRQKGFYRHPPV